MSRLDSIRSKIANKIFIGIGTTGSLETVNTNTTDKWGDASITYNAATELIIVPYNLIDYNRSYMPFGDLGEKETDAIIPYDTSFGVNDRITFDGQAYKIINNEKFLFQGGNLAYAIRMVKQH